MAHTAGEKGRGKLDLCNPEEREAGNWAVHMAWDEAGLCTLCVQWRVWPWADLSF